MLEGKERGFRMMDEFEETAIESFFADYDDLDGARMLINVNCLSQFIQRRGSH